MCADLSNNDRSEFGSSAMQPPESKPADRKGPGAARGLAEFVESFLGGSRLRRLGVPTKTDAPQAEEPPELLDLLLEGPDAIIVLDRQQGEIIEVNHRFAEWTGVDRESLAGRMFLELFPEPERKAARTLFEDAGAGGVHVIEVPSAIKDERSRLVEFTSSRSKSGSGAFAVVVGRDVGERAATERYLRAERDRLGLFMRAMRDMLILLSPAGDILFANSAAEQCFEPYELPVVCHRWLSEFTKDDSANLQGLASAYEGRTLEVEDAKGTVYLVTRSFIFESGQKAMVMLMAKDISDQRIMEKQNHQLEIELIRESKLAEFGTLSAGIAHNLNGPLTGILGFCDLIELIKPGQSEIAQIRSQAITMRDIVANLLHKSRSERENQPQDLLIEDIIRTELRFLDANLFFKHDVKKVIELDPDSPTLYGVYIDFSQVVGNLLRNAIDAMFKSDTRVLTVRTHHDDEHLMVTISDTGCGMSADVRKKLFQPFFTTKPKTQDAKPGEPTGTGLGLSTSRNILARYGAEMNVESEAGKGSTFSITFPRHRKPTL
jgi:two-component system NtrC family sensor kinase